MLVQAIISILMHVRHDKSIRKYAIRFCIENYLIVVIQIRWKLFNDLILSNFAMGPSDIQLWIITSMPPCYPFMLKGVIQAVNVLKRGKSFFQK